MGKYDNILQPITIGNIVLKNRLISSNALPHFLQGPETWINDPIMVYQANVAKNAAIVTMGNWTDPNQHTGMHHGDGCHFPSFDIRDPSVENSICLYCDIIHMYGAKATMSMITFAPDGYDVCDGAGGMMPPPMGGGPADADDEDAPPPMMGGPDGFPPMGGEGEEPDEMRKMMDKMMAPKKAVTPAIMEDIIKDTVKECKYWQSLGFDGVSFHMAYQAPLTAKFLSPATNHRTDEYGGSMENRSRFPLAICQAVKEACGQDFIVEVLMSGKEAEGGITIEDTVQFAHLAEGKVDILQIRGGDGDEAHPTTFNSIKEAPVTLEVAEAVKKSGANIIVAPIGGYEYPDLVSQWIAEGKMDMMASGRTFVCDPDYVQKLTEERGDDVVPCIRCNKCHGLSNDGPWLTVCSVNPKVGLDHISQRLFQPAARSKKVAVIGGGPAGLYAAMTLADRGHQVTVYERESTLGGQLIHSDYAGFKWTIKEFKNWLVAQCEKRGVDILLGQNATPESIKAQGYDAVLACTGAEANIPDIPGLTKADGSLADKVFTPLSVFGGLDKLGQRVAVIGGSEIGCETGMYVAESGREVTVFTRQSQLAPSAQRVHYGLPALGYHGLKQKLCCTTVKVEDGKVCYKNYKGQEKTLEFDSIIISGGENPRYKEALAFFGSAPEFYMAGDCAGSGEGTIQKAVRSAWSAAMRI